LAVRFFAAGRFLAALPFFAFFEAFFRAGFAGLRFDERFLAGGGLDADAAAVSANVACGASPKSSGGGELTPSSLMAVHPF
jgi:hypothetical protein